MSEERAAFVLAFDLATRTGWAMGAPDDPAPLSGAVSLWNSKRDPDGRWQRNMRALFLDLINERRPDVVIWETPLTPEAWKRRAEETGRPQNGPSLIMQNSQSDILKGCCDARGIVWHTTARQSVLKHYTGRGSWTSAPKAGDGRERGKEAVIRQAITLGHLPPGCKDEDRADSIALWSYACGLYGKITAPPPLQLFDPGRMAHQSSPQRSILDD